MYKHSSTFQLFLSKGIIALLIASLFVLSGVSFVYAQEPGSEWVSFTLRRVNLREAPTIRSYVKTVLDEGTPVHIFDEVQGLDDEVSGWMHVYVSEGDSGWISKDFIVSKDALENIKTALMQSLILPQQVFERSTSVGKEEIPETVIPDFTEEKEPKIPGEKESETSKQSGEDEQGSSFFDVFFQFLFVVSVIANIVFLYLIISYNKAGRLLSDADTLQKEYQLLMNANKELDNRIHFAEKKYSDLEKTLSKKEKGLQSQKELQQEELTKLRDDYNQLYETHSQFVTTNKSKDEQIEKLTQENNNLLKELENIHENLNKSTENIQQQAVKFTMTEQTHKEKLISKDDEIQRLQRQSDELQQSKEQLQKEFLEKTDGLKKENASLQAKIQEVEITLAEKNKSINEEITQAKIDLETSLEKQFNERLTEVQKTQEEKYSQEIEAVKVMMEKEKASLIENNKDLQQKFKAIETKYIEEKKERQELEAQTDKFEKPETSVEAAFEDLQKEYDALVSSYEEAQQQLKDAQTAREAERELISKTVISEAEDERTIPEQKAGLKAAGKAVETPEKVIQPQPAPADTGRQEEYARSLFKKLRQL